MTRASPAPTAATIVAIATPPGAGAIGIVRVSGPRACESVSPMLRLSGGRKIETAPPRMLHRARVLDPTTGAQLDDALVVFMPGPHSYTGEDVIEISGHGSPVLLAEIVTKLVGAGLRLAEPGEFTRRAYLNGRLDLVQAEAVALLIGARTERAARLAARQVDGALSAEVRALRESVLDLVAGLEVSLDFPDDAVGLSCSTAAERCQQVATRLGRLVAGARHGRLLDEGLVVVLAGAPNVGKSSLLNALLGRDRAIVSPDPGTTRDVVDGAVMVEGVTVRIMDGAGLGIPRDSVDAEGMMRSRRAIDESDLVVVVLDRSRPRTVADEEVLHLGSNRPRLVIANKSDLPAAWPDDGVDCVCSALNELGIEGLRKCLAAWVRERLSTDAEEGGMVASLRVIGRLKEAQTGLDLAGAGLGTGMPLEAVLIDLRVALSALDETLGCQADDAVLDRIFATFCVGK